MIFGVCQRSSPKPDKLFFVVEDWLEVENNLVVSHQRQQTPDSDSNCLNLHFPKYQPQPTKGVLEPVSGRIMDLSTIFPTESDNRFPSCQAKF